MATVLDMANETPLPTLPVTITDRGDRERRQRLTSRARWLTQLGLAWHVLEAAIAVAAGLIAGSVALVGFGADSVIEAAAGLVVLWLVTGERVTSHRAERRARQLISGSFLALALYVTIESARDLIAGHHPAVSWAGVALAAITLLAMPPLAAAKRRVGTALGSSAAASESRQSMLCAYLSAALLVGLLANALAGWWWADPGVALLIAAVALPEARAAWHGESCTCCSLDPTLLLRLGVGHMQEHDTDLRSAEYEGRGRAPARQARGGRGVVAADRAIGAEGCDETGDDREHRELPADRVV
jgi:Cation efflux family